MEVIAHMYAKKALAINGKYFTRVSFHTHRNRNAGTGLDQASF